MSRIDGYEAQRGPVHRRKRRNYPISKERAKRAMQVAMELYGGATRKEITEGEPFDDDISRIGR